MVFFDDNPVSLILFLVDELFGRVYFADVAVLLDNPQALRVVSENVEHYFEQIIQILDWTSVCYGG